MRPSRPTSYVGDSSGWVEGAGSTGFGRVDHSYHHWHQQQRKSTTPFICTLLAALTLSPSTGAASAPSEDAHNTLSGVATTCWRSPGAATGTSRRPMG